MCESICMYVSDYVVYVYGMYTCKWRYEARGVSRVLIHSSQPNSLEMGMSHWTQVFMLAQKELLAIEYFSHNQWNYFIQRPLIINKNVYKYQCKCDLCINIKLFYSLNALIFYIAFN